MSDLDPVSFRVLLDRVPAVARRHFRKVFLPVALPLAAAGLLATALQAAWLGALVAGDFSQILPMIGGVFMMLLIILGIYTLGYMALMTASLDAVAGRPVEMGRAWRFALRPRVLGTLVVVGICQILSFMMCVVPALWVGPILSYVMPAMVEEDLYGTAAIRRSVELAHHNPTGRLTDSAWLKTLVFLLVGLVINYAVSMTVQMPFAIAQQVIVLRDAVSQTAADPAALVSGTLWLQLPAQVLGAFATAATWLYWTFGISLLYRELKRRKEGDDLRRAIAQLTGAVGEERTPDV